MKYNEVLEGPWLELNAVLQLASEKEVLHLLSAEEKGERRARVLLRIHSRYNKLRAARERKELIGK